MRISGTIILMLSIQGIFAVRGTTGQTRKYTRTNELCNEPGKTTSRGVCLNSITDGRHYIYTEDNPSAGNPSVSSYSSHSNQGSNGMRGFSAYQQGSQRNDVSSGCPDGKCGLNRSSVRSNGAQKSFADRSLYSVSGCPDGQCGLNRSGRGRTNSYDFHSSFKDQASVTMPSCPDGKCGLNQSAGGRSNPYGWASGQGTGYRGTCSTGNCGYQVSCPTGNCPTRANCPDGKCGIRASCPNGNCGSQTSCSTGNCGKAQGTWSESSYDSSW
jgi:hypothetical protein